MYYTKRSDYPYFAVIIVSIVSVTNCIIIIYSVFNIITNTTSVYVSYSPLISGVLGGWKVCKYNIHDQYKYYSISPIRMHANMCVLTTM